MKVSAKLTNLRIAPRKIRLVTDLISGLDVAEALNQLDATVKGGVQPVQKLLQSAISNGENNFGVDKDNMYVYRINVNAGSTLKRWMPKAYGRAGQILKRTTQMEIILEEKVEGKGRKSREQLEKEKKERMEARKKIERAAEKKAKEKEEEDKQEETAVKKERIADKGKKVEKKGGLTSRIFRRKSM